MVDVCGRYALAKDPAALAVEFDVAVPEERLVPDYNLAPTKSAYIVVDRVVGEGSDLRERTLEAARWGLIPSWAKDPSIGSKLINARSETLSEKPSFRSAYGKRRCLVPADGYYEWQVLPGAGGKPQKQPYFIHRSDGVSLPMAGLYEWWRDRERPDDDPAAWRLTFTVITTDADENLAHIHDRMPVMINSADWEAWLSPDTPPADIATLLTREYTAPLESYPVAPLVSNVRNSGPELVIPLRDAE